MELSYKQRLEDVARSRPESNSSFLGSSCGGPRSAVQRLRSAQMRPSDLKPLNNNPYSQVSRDMSNPNIAIEEEEGEDVYTRFSKHVAARGIEKQAFCKPVDLYLTPAELKQCFAQVGFSASEEEVACVFLDAKKTGYLEVDDFFKKLSCWKEGAEKKVQIVAKQVEIRRRPITASQATKQDLFSSYSLGSQPVKVQGRPESAITKVTPLRSGRSLRVAPDDGNKSKHYLRLAKLR